jgi:hypothetical protein
MRLAERIRCGSITGMRTTLDLDEDVMLAAKELAVRSKRSAGKVISEVFRRGLHAGETPVASRRTRANVAAGFEVLPAGGRVVTAELVSKLRDETETR